MPNRRAGNGARSDVADTVTVVRAVARHPTMRQMSAGKRRARSHQDQTIGAAPLPALHLRRISALRK
jgi:hypothetical protein